MAGGLFLVARRNRRQQREPPLGAVGAEAAELRRHPLEELFHGRSSPVTMLPCRRHRKRQAGDVRQTCVSRL